MRRSRDENVDDLLQRCFYHDSKHHGLTADLKHAKCSVLFALGVGKTEERHFAEA